MRQMNDGPPRWRPGRASGSGRVGVNRTRLIGPPPLSSSGAPRYGPAPRWGYQPAGSRRERTAGRRRATLALLLIAGAVVAGVLLRADRAVAAWLRRDRDVNMRVLVADTRYAEAVDAAELTLVRRPLDAEANLIRGVASLYAAIDGGSGVSSTDRLSTAIVSLRRALLDSRIAVAEPAAQYALGKAYYHKGYFYYDLAVRYLESSLALGYDGADTYEYLGLAYTELGDPRGLEYFRHALTRRPSDLLHLKMATMLMDEGDVQGARRNLMQAIDLTDDTAIAQRARYELGAVYRALGELLLAEEQYRAIIAGDGRAADAHFYLGEIYSQQGDSDRALAQWRAARELDPNHRRAIERLR